MVCATAAGILVFFQLLRAETLQLLQVDLSAFQIAGGVLIFVAAIGMVQGNAVRLENRDEDPANEKLAVNSRFKKFLIPMGIPMLAGPGTITVTILFGIKADDQWGQRLLLAAATFSPCLQSTRFHGPLLG